MNTTYINLFTTGACQNRCWYCIEGCQDNRLRGHIDMSTFKRVIDFIKAQEQEHVKFHFYGGEPLLHPQIWSMTEILRHMFDSIEFKISTNLCHPRKVVQEIPSDFNVMASFHSDWFDKDYWYESALWVKDNCRLSEAALMVQNRNLTEIIILYDQWIDTLPVSLYPIDQFKGKDGFTKLIMNMNPSIHIHTEDNCGTKGCMCSAGWDIDEKGNVTKCSAHKNLIYMNVNDTVSKLPVWSVCFDASDCPCDYEFEKKHIRKIT